MNLYQPPSPQHQQLPAAINNNKRYDHSLRAGPVNNGVGCLDRCVSLYHGIKGRRTFAIPFGMYSIGMLCCVECSVFFKPEQVRKTRAGQLRCKCCNTRLRTRPAHKLSMQYWDREIDKKRY